jgi:hypothetical protein
MNILKNNQTARRIFATAILISVSTLLFASDPYPVLTEKGAKLLFESAERASMDYGYDSDIQLYCIFSVSTVQTPSTTTAVKQPKKVEPSSFAQYLDKADSEVIWEVYEKLTANLAAARYLQRYYTKKKTWKYVNYLKKNVIPGNEAMIKTFEDYIKKNQSLNSRLSSSSLELGDAAKRSILWQKERIAIVDEYQ